MLALAASLGYNCSTLGGVTKNSLFPTLPPPGDGAGEETFHRSCFVLLAGRVASVGEDVRGCAVPAVRAHGGAWAGAIGRRTENDARCRAGHLSASIMESF